MTISEFIKKQGISKEVFAKFVELSPASVYKYCTGERVPSLKTAARIEKMTRGQVTMSDMLPKK